MRSLVVLLSLILLLRPAYGFFGSDAAIMMPVLTQQLAVLNDSLSTAHESLEGLQDLQRGIENVVDIDLSMDGLAGVLAQDRELVRFSANLNDINDSLEELTPLDGDVLGDVPDLRQARMNRSLTKAALLMAEGMKQASVGKEALQGARFMEAGQNAQSGAEAAKITAQGTGVLIYQNSEQLALESQQLELQAMELELETSKTHQDVQAETLESEHIKKGFDDLQPMR